MEGIATLAFLILCAGGMNERCPALCAENIEHMVQHRRYLPTGWTDFYKNCGTKYKGFVYPSGSTTRVGSSRKRQADVGCRKCPRR